MHNYLDLLATISLEFSRESIIIPIIIIGYICSNRDLFFHSMCLVLISIILNAALKSSFQIPLNPDLGKEGFAFPSGHMQTSVVFYGFFYTFTQNKILKTCLINLLIMIGASLIYFHYHNLTDIIGAIISALTIIYIYKHVVIKKSYFKQTQLFLIIIAFVSTCLVYINLTHTIHLHLWKTYYALIGLFVSQNYFNDTKKLTKTTKITALVLCFICLFLVKKATTIALFSWFFIGLSIPFSVFIANLVCNKLTLLKIKNKP